MSERKVWQYQKCDSDEASALFLNHIASGLGVEFNDLDYARYAEEAWIGVVDLMGKKAVIVVARGRDSLSAQLAGQTTANILTPNESVGATGLYLSTAPLFNNVVSEFMQTKAEQLKSGKEHLEFDWEILTGEARIEHENRFDEWWIRQITKLRNQVEE